MSHIILWVVKGLLTAHKSIMHRIPARWARVWFSLKSSTDHATKEQAMWQQNKLIFLVQKESYPFTSRGSISLFWLCSLRQWRLKQTETGTAQLSANKGFGLQLICVRRETCPQWFVTARASKSSGEAEGATAEVMLSWWVNGPQQILSSIHMQSHLCSESGEH